MENAKSKFLEFINKIAQIYCTTLTPYINVTNWEINERRVIRVDNSQ